jgi:hypothetical protein
MKDHLLTAEIKFSVLLNEQYLPHFTSLHIRSLVTVASGVHTVVLA